MCQTWILIIIKSVHSIMKPSLISSSVILTNLRGFWGGKTEVLHEMMRFFQFYFACHWHFLLHCSQLFNFICCHCQFRSRLGQLSAKFATLFDFFPFFQFFYRLKSPNSSFSSSSSPHLSSTAHLLFVVVMGNLSLNSGLTPSRKCNKKGGRFMCLAGEINDL